ncbi:MAG: YggS family pyridoxal phosphate-dependent enzyme [Anaerolineales bacterium]|nr:YggS family pyridoxal phosphate-dependent enzyme [Anaerolineales bacterium]MCS7248949.1 YggS family pyridoxal phosphate-dependent enzyme [Anaerolineales bacterium]MDW8162762.1 YggS family pyridoxal phosphate-dependent enzyme [Anaerolineales bacterium]MDW8445864.1 YggS family pyridoxal phosphate-dependent enzyme [Anaerolineales bacterium]
MLETKSVEEIKSEIARNYHAVLERIAGACLRVGRSPREVTLVVVTKGHSVERIQCAVELGMRKFGENYAEEGASKIASLSQHPELEWHMIGHIQSRKAELVVRYYDMVHSLDSVRLARRLERFAAENDRKIPVLLECNVSGEETKFGFDAADPERWLNLIPEFAEIAQLPHLEVCGLMTMAPFYENPENARPVFRRLVELQSYLRKHLPEVDWRELSMGMSSDFEIAIEEGATMVRIGQAILGERPHR